MPRSVWSLNGPIDNNLLIIYNLPKKPLMIQKQNDSSGSGLGPIFGPFLGIGPGSTIHDLSVGLRHGPKEAQLRLAEGLQSRLLTNSHKSTKIATRVIFATRPIEESSRVRKPRLRRFVRSRATTRGGGPPWVLYSFFVIYRSE